MQLSDDQRQEVGGLKKQATLVMLWLTGLAIVSLAASVTLVGGAIVAPDPFHRILLCILGGMLGSSISALVSAGERISHGWELSDGIKYPARQPVDKFVARMVPLFLIRPLLGAAIGLLLYIGITGDFLLATQRTQESGLSDSGLLFVATLAGIFAKTLLERLRDMFDALFGKSGSVTAPKDDG